jgi:hypothetical protein
MGTVGTIANMTAAMTAISRSAAVRIRGSYNLSIWGVFVATGRLERSFDGGTTWIPVSKDSSGADASFTAPCGITGYEPEDGVLYSFNCSAYTSGTMNVRISQ